MNPDLAPADRERCRLLYLCSPRNPGGTGRVRMALVDGLEYCVEAVRRSTAPRLRLRC